MEGSNYVNAVNPTINRVPPPPTYALLNDPTPPRAIIIFHSLVSPGSPENPDEETNASSIFSTRFPTTEFFFLFLLRSSSNNFERKEKGVGR